jgi:outer membrane protein assembly factor BamB
MFRSVTGRKMRNTLKRRSPLGRAAFIRSIVTQSLRNNAMPVSPARELRPTPRRAIGPLALGLMLVASSRAARAGDWPQILGPNRNGVAVDEAAPDQLPAALRVVWEIPIGQGYAGPAVVGSHVVVFHRMGDLERVQSVDRATGQTRWQHDFDANYRGGVDPDTGPRCVPLISQQIVLAYGAGGVLRALQLADGKPLWSRDLLDDFGGSDGYFGAGTSPIVVGNRVLVNAGGRRGAGLVALALQTGETLWQATDDGASYSSPTLVTRGGQTRVLFVTRLNALLVDPQDGRVMARYPFGRSGPTVNAASPIVFDDYAFLTASYRVGAVLLKFAGDGWQQIWANDDSLSSQYNTPVELDGFLYGIHGREDLGPADLRCVEAATGRVRWSEPGFGVAHLLRLGHRLLILKVDGTLVLAAADPDKFQPLGQATVSPSTTRAMPAVSQGMLFLRDTTATGGRLLCLEL